VERLSSQTALWSQPDSWAGPFFFASFFFFARRRNSSAKKIYNPAAQRLTAQCRRCSFALFFREWAGCVRAGHSPIPPLRPLGPLPCTSAFAGHGRPRCFWSRAGEFAGQASPVQNAKRLYGLRNDHWACKRQRSGFNSVVPDLLSDQLAATGSMNRSLP